jgi:hypothetical protein
MNNKCVLIVGGGSAYNNLFTGAGWMVTHEASRADMVLFTGGEDVSPDLYGEERHPRTYNCEKRDMDEKAIYEALKGKVPMVGICRGGQFLNVMNGGKMYQHVASHTSSHTMVDTLSGEEIYVTSTHHQMMRPGPGALLVAIANEGGGKEWMNGKTINQTFEGPDIEVVYYPDTECLCFQPHPEFYIWGESKWKDMREYFFKLIQQYFLFEYKAAP